MLAHAHAGRNLNTRRYRSPIATEVALAGSGQDSVRASLDNDVQQTHVLAESWDKPFASAMGFLTVNSSASIIDGSWNICDTPFPCEEYDILIFQLV